MLETFFFVTYAVNHLLALRSCAHWFLLGLPYIVKLPPKMFQHALLSLFIFWFCLCEARSPSAAEANLACGASRVGCCGSRNAHQTRITEVVSCPQFYEWRQFLILAFTFSVLEMLDVFPVLTGHFFVSFVNCPYLLSWENAFQHES